MIKIPSSEYKFTFSRSSGAGGQNVNKVNTRATLTWNMTNSLYCKQEIKDRFEKKYSRFLSGHYVVIHSQKYRSQSKNVEDCISKLEKYLSNVEYAPKKRVATKPSRGAVKKRLDQKSKDSMKKKIRQEKF